MNFRFRVSHIFSHGTRSATTKGTRSYGGARQHQDSIGTALGHRFGTAFGTAPAQPWSLLVLEPDPALAPQQVLPHPSRSPQPSLAALTISEKALSHSTVALALLSWFPWTMTTMGRDRTWARGALPSARAQPPTAPRPPRAIPAWTRAARGGRTRVPEGGSVLPRRGAGTWRCTVRLLGLRATVVLNRTAHFSSVTDSDPFRSQRFIFFSS